MATSTKAGLPATVFNLPNQLTILRLVLAVVLFALMAWECYAVSLVVFVVAAGTDWLDGYLARRWGLVTMLGRILDPFADKMIICGTFIFLAAVPRPELRELGLQAWVVALVVGRELLITALRSFLEQQGADFSASMSGKLKMVAQCAAAISALALLTFARPEDVPAWLPPLVRISVWSTVVLTVWSGVVYLRAALRLLHAA